MEEKQELPQVAKGQFDIPTGWTWSEVKEVANAVFDGPFGSHLKTEDYTPSGVRVIRLENLGYLSFKGDKTTYISQEKYEALKQHTIYEGDIIVGSFIADGVKAALIPKLGETAIAKADCFCVRYNPAVVDNKYLHYALSTGFISEGYLTIMRGVTRSRINTSQLKQTLIPLAPLPEQRRIVAKLEELFSRLDAGVAAVRRAQALLKRYRQSVLHAAVTGELTRVWREAHPAPAETGSALLARIRSERRAQWEAAQVAKRGGQLPLNDAWKKKYEEPAAPDTSELPELPAGWAWARIGHLADIKGGKRLPAGHDYADEETAYPYLRVTDFEQGTIRQSKLKYLSPETAALISRYTISSADVYISIAGSIGVTGTVPENLSGANLTENAAKMCNIPFMPVKYIHYFFSSSLGSNQTADSTVSTTQPKLALFRIEQIAIPLPPLAEQAEIVAEVERRLTVLDALGQTLADELKRAERLRQSLLHRAFTGCLVPQDATDEPAALLARLRAVAAGPTKAKAGRGRKVNIQQATLEL
jgi:type I restriction enzyme S subunit